MKGSMLKGFVILAALAGVWFAHRPAAAAAPCESASQNGGGDPHALLTRYWTSRQSLREHFVRNDLDEEGNLQGDGIGEWDPGRRAYDKAGFGMTANYLIMAHDPNPGCNNGAQPNYDPSLKNILGFGDCTIHLGRHIAFLSSEYHLLGRNGQKQAQQRTLNELFLALQAYRRLDMTANRLWKMKMNACGQAGCSWQPDLSGYSGWFLRDDVPFDFYENFPADVEDEWKVGGIKSDYACRAAKLICEDFPKVASQDQVIGMLFGLAFVKRFVPAEAEVHVDGVRYNLLNMAQKIAYGMVNRILKADGHKILFPRCSEEPVEIGAETDWQLYGMIKVANFILPSGQQFNPTVGMKLAWEAARTGIFATNGWGKFYNVRMVLELIAAGNVNYNDTARKKADPDYFIMHFVYAALHNKAVSAAELDRMACTLCAYQCPGPCQRTGFYDELPVGPPFACPNLPGGAANSGGGGCDPRAWCKGFWTGDLDCSPVAYHGQKFTPVSYLLAYNLFHLMRGTAYTYDYDPGMIEMSSQLAGADLSIVGPDALLPEQAKVYELRAAPGATAFLWETSPNLEIVGIVGSDPRKVSVRALPNASGPAWIEAADAAIDDDGPCDRSPRARKPVTIGSPPSPPPALNGALPGKVATAPEDYCDRCVSNPPAQVGQSLVSNPDFVMGYHSGKSAAGMSAPYDGNGTLDQRQGLQRLYRDGRNYLIVSNSTLGKSWAGFETVALGSNPGEPFELYATLGQPGACPPNTDRIVRYTSRPFFTHAGGIQVLGNRFLAVGFARPDAQHPSDKPQWCLYDLADPQSPVRLSCTPLGMGWAGAVALTRLNTGRYMAWVFGPDAETVEIFTADSPQSAQWLSHGVHDPFGSGWNAYRGLQFLTGCDGRLFLAASHNNGGGNGEDWLDLWQVTFDNNSLVKPRVEKVAKRHMTCSNAGTGDVRYCNFKAGAGAYVTPEGHLLFYGVEHHNDICGGKGVKWREFPNAANGH